MKFRFLSMLAIFPLIAGCLSAEQVATIYANQRQPTTAERSSLVATLRTTLYDPYSVRDAAISNVLHPQAVSSASRNAKAICVRMNSRNRFGAYVGLQYTMYKYSSSGALIGVDDSPIAQQQCADGRLGYSAFAELENL